jgi:hypothetical protein
MFEINWKKFTVNVIIGYVISWAYFFITLPLFYLVLGKVTGTILNYGISWLVWLGATYYLHKYYPKWG